MYNAFMEIIQKFITNPKNFTKGRNNNKVTGLILHTYGGYGDDLYTWWQNNKVPVSTHFCILKDGRVIQYVREEDTAYHTVGDGNQNVQTIGIEFQDDNNWESPQTYTQIQLQSAAELLVYLHIKYSFKLEYLKSGGVALHCDHDPKPCPGALPYQEIIQMANDILKVNQDFMEKRYNFAIASLQQHKLAVIRKDENTELQFAHFNQNTGIWTEFENMPGAKSEREIHLEEDIDCIWLHVRGIDGQMYSRKWEPTFGWSDWYSTIKNSESRKQ